MNSEAIQASRVIDSVARAVANWTVDQHAEINPRLAGAYGDNWRSDWIGHTLAQIHLLAQAVAVRNPELFAGSIQWTHESFQSRGIDANDLRQNTVCMQQVLIKELPPPLGDTISPYFLAALDAVRDAKPLPAAADLSDAPHGTLILEYLHAILEADREAAERLILGHVHAGCSIQDLYEQVLAPAQARLGWMWHRGEISVADEHFGSATTQLIMSQVRPLFERAPANGRIVVCTSTPGDLHEIGLRMVADLFELDGWTVMFLGANTPAADVVEMLARRKPDLLALSVSTALTLRSAGETIATIRANPTVAHTKIIIGGPPFRTVDNLWQELGADACAVSATAAVTEGNRLAASGAA
jgi:methanogenic corrinoid protein MtbC1